nr:MAG TPA: hypothetical protein [Caudoviricetes sp.]
MIGDEISVLIYMQKGIEQMKLLIRSSVLYISA